MGIGGEVMRRAVFLDRDGVLNRAFVRAGTPHPPPSLAELELLPGVPQAIRALKAGGYWLVVVTNQPDIARGMVPRAVSEEMNRWLKATLPIDAVLMCAHDDSDQCGCRKPRPGLILQAARDFEIDCGSSYMVGDRWKDMEAGRRAGCTTFFVDHGYGEALPESYDFRVSSLLDAARTLLRSGRPA
jgi:D-glycero-D-manno-heptose 1,7-bisphosphate phosphatase